MLRNDLVADLFTQYFNEAGKEFNKVFEIYDSATDYKIVKPLSIVGILSETGGSVKPVMNYVNTTCNYEIGLLYSVEAGFGEIKKMNEIIENVIKALNGVPLQLSGGQALITFNPQHTGDYEINRPRIGKSVIPKLTFKVEYSQKQDGFRYEMALIDTPFDMTTHDTRYFNSQSEQQTYYLNKVAESGVPFCEMMAPNVNSLTLQQQVYINDLRYYPSGTTKVKDLNEILMKNYAIIRAMDGDTAVAYYYYWVQNANVGDNNQALLDLKMDTIQTWHFDPDIVYSDCMIHKAHLNRWIDNGDGTVSFDGTINSKLFEREDIQNVAKRLTKRTVVDIFPGSSEVAEWLNENIAGWLYVYLSSHSPYNLYGVSLEDTMASITLNATTLRNDAGGQVYSPIAVATIPFYKDTSKRILIHTTSTDSNYLKLVLDNYSLSDFMTANNQGARIYAIKLSAFPPIYDAFDSTSYEIDTDGNLIFKLPPDSYIPSLSQLHTYVGLNSVINRTGNTAHSNYSGTPHYSGMLFLRNITNSINLTYTTPQSLSFLKSSVIGSSKNHNYNPKLLSNDYFEIKLSDSTEDGFSYDLQKLNKTFLSISYSETITPDITKKYIRFSDLDGVYIGETSSNLLGFVNSNDESITMETTEYAEMLAQNKNFFIQNAVNRNYSIGMGLAAGAVTTLSGAATLNPMTAIGGIGAMIYSGLNYSKDKINENLTIDNLKNAPATINAKGNAYFQCLYSQLGVIIEEYDILPNEKEIINDYMDMYGFTYNKVDNIKNCDNIRYYHNYIEADLTNIKGISISNVIRDDIKNRFIGGVRFWNTDNIQYTLENYEKWLSE